jgi:hypothetical protein
MTSSTWLSPTRKPLEELDAAGVREQLAAAAAAARANAEWIRDTFERCVTVEPGDLLWDDEVVTSGGRFVDVMLGRPHAVVQALAALWLEHRLTAAQKKTLLSQRGSATGSKPAPSLATRGRKRARAVSRVASKGSARAVAATGPCSAASSGTTALASS